VLNQKITLSIFVLSTILIFPVVQAFALPPTITITSPTGGVIITTSTVTVTGTASDPTGIKRVEVSVDGSAFSLATSNSPPSLPPWSEWEFTTGVLSLGSHTIVATATSNAGNIATTTITVGDFPYGVAANPITNIVYVANQKSSTVSVIDGKPGSPTENTVTATIPVGDMPRGVAVNPTTNKVYVTIYDLGNVSVIDGTTNAVTSTITVGTNPQFVAVNPTTNTIYVTNSGPNSVSVIDGTTNAVTSTIPVGTGPYGIAVNPITNTIYVSNHDSNSVSVIDGATNTVTATILPVNNPRDITVNPTTNTVYVSGSTSTVYVIDGKPGSPTQNTITSTMTVGSTPIGITVNPTTNIIYVTNELSQSVSIIDGNPGSSLQNTITDTVIVGVRPQSVAVNPTTDTAYVTNLISTVSVINGATSAQTSVSFTSSHLNTCLLDPRHCKLIDFITLNQLREKIPVNICDIIPCAPKPICPHCPQFLTKELLLNIQKEFPPVQQLKAGIDLKDIVPIDGQVLIIDNHRTYPISVKQNTAEILISRNSPNWHFP